MIGMNDLTMSIIMFSMLEDEGSFAEELSWELEDTGELFCLEPNDFLTTLAKDLAELIMVCGKSLLFDRFGGGFLGGTCLLVPSVEPLLERDLEAKFLLDLDLTRS